MKKTRDLNNLACCIPDAKVHLIELIRYLLQNQNRSLNWSLEIGRLQGDAGSIQCIDFYFTEGKFC